MKTIECPGAEPRHMAVCNLDTDLESGLGNAHFLPQARFSILFELPRKLLRFPARNFALEYVLIYRMGPLHSM